MYREMHVQGERHLGIPAQQTFDGRSLPSQATRIKRLISETGARTLLDYGSGKGQQYDPRPFRVAGEGEWQGILDYWDVDEVRCFDPGYAPYSRLPEGKFDGVISTDVLEHCPQEDIDWVLEEMFGFAARFVFATIACFPAKKRLPNGENAHCTIQPPQWWRAAFELAAARQPAVHWQAWVVLSREGEMDMISGGSKAAEPSVRG
jgi:hypothetical protein